MFSLMWMTLNDERHQRHLVIKSEYLHPHPHLHQQTVSLHLQCSCTNNVVVDNWRWRLYKMKMWLHFPQVYCVPSSSSSRKLPKENVKDNRNKIRIDHIGRRFTWNFIFIMDFHCFEHITALRIKIHNFALFVIFKVLMYLFSSKVNFVMFSERLRLIIMQKSWKWC